MKTLVTDSTDEAAAFVRSGRIAAFPTETVYGLGADVFDEAAVSGIFEAKGRPADNPLIAHVSGVEQILRVAAEIPPVAERLIETFLPGPLTVVLPRRGDVPSNVTAGLDTIGVRMPSHPVARDFLERCGTPIAAPSANRSGRPSPTTWQAVLEDLDGRIPCVLKGGRAEVGLESTVVDCSGPEPVILRAGGYSLEQLLRAAPDIRVAEPSDPRARRSPGLRHRHYAPHARVQIVDAPPARPPAKGTYIGLSAPPDAEAYLHVRHAASTEEYARELFHFLRESDALGAEVVYCQMVPDVGIGRAVADRIRRAAEGAGREPSGGDETSRG